jgi:hypothetical protein
VKIPLVGQSYSLRSPAAAAQQTLNLIPQFIDDPNEQGKNKGILVGAPGYHLMANANTLGSVSNHVFRGLWSGGGRLFALTDSNSGVPGGSTILWEFGLNTYVGGNPSSGSASMVSKNTLPGPTSDGLTGQMFGNGNQLGIIKNGNFFIDPGQFVATPQQARFLISGTVNTTSGASGTSTAVWQTGDKFPATLNTPGAYITINGANYPIATYTDTTHLNLTMDAGTQTGATYQAPAGDLVTAVTGAYLDGYFVVQRPSGQLSIAGTATCAGGGDQNVFWVSGSFFDNLAPGSTFTFNSVNYVVDTVISSTHITVTGTPAAVTTTFSALVGGDLGRQFNISHLLDGTSWDPLDFAQKSGYPDYIKSILADHEQLYLLGTESVEVWQDTGNALFPFQRIPGAMAKEGSTATFAPVAMGERVYYLGGSPRGGPVAYRLDGFTPVRISTHAEEAAWTAGTTTPSTAVSYTEIHDGHQFWVINFSGTQHCWVYDETASQQAGTPIWHQRAFWNGAAFAAYAPWYHAFIPEWGPAGLHVVAELTSANFHELNLNYFDDNTASKAWVRILPHLYAHGMTQYFGRMTLEMETGSVASGAQPLITRDYSDDRGNTFGNAVTAGAGVNAAYSQRVYWPANGSSRDRNFRFSGSGQYRTTLIDLDLDVEIGTA